MKSHVTNDPNDAEQRAVRPPRIVISKHSERAPRPCLAQRLFFLFNNNKKNIKNKKLFLANNILTSYHCKNGFYFCRAIMEPMCLSAMRNNFFSHFWNHKTLCFMTHYQNIWLTSIFLQSSFFTIEHKPKMPLKKKSSLLIDTSVCYYTHDCLCFVLRI